MKCYIKFGGLSRFYYLTYCTGGMLIMVFEFTELV